MIFKIIFLSKLFKTIFLDNKNQIDKKFLGVPKNSLLKLVILPNL